MTHNFFIDSLKFHIAAPIFVKIHPEHLSHSRFTSRHQASPRRRLGLLSQTTLKQFHRILQLVMGWENYHFHEFLVGTKRYGVPDPTYDAPSDVRHIVH